MYFSEREQQGVPEIDTGELEQRLQDLAQRLRELPEWYRAFGPGWWIVKAALRRRFHKRDWFTGPAEDREILATLFPDRIGEETEGNPPASQEHPELLRRAFGYYDTESADGEPISELHIVEGADGAFLYRIQDPDASRQLDLFEEVANEERRREEFLRRTATFLPGPWLQAGDRAAAAGDGALAVARYKRALAVAHDEESRLQSWLRIGTTHHEAGQQEKAIVAFEQAYRRTEEGWILGLIGQAALAAGRYGEAAQQFSAALESMPGNPEYRAGLEAARSALDSQDRELAIG